MKVIVAPALHRKIMLESVFPIISVIKKSLILVSSPLTLNLPHWKLACTTYSSLIVTFQFYYKFFSFFFNWSKNFWSLAQACHTKEKYEEHGASICRSNPVFKGMYWTGDELVNHITVAFFMKLFDQWGWVFFLPRCIHIGRSWCNKYIHWVNG